MCNYDEDFYINPDLKKRFLKQYVGKTVDSYYGILKKASSVFEKKFKRDIYTSNSNDANDIIQMMNARTANAAHVYRTVLANYVDFCIREGYEVPSTINWFKIITKDDLKTMIGNSKIKVEGYVTRKELYQIAEKFEENYSYIVPYILAFESVRGNKWEELFNLKKQDLDFSNNSIIITNLEDNTIKRTIENVDPISMDIIKKGLNAQSIFVQNEKDLGQYSDSDYILKGYKGQPMKYNTFYGKINSKVNNVLGYKFAPLTAWRSGLYERLLKREIQKENELKIDNSKAILSADDYIEVMKEFGTEQYYINIKDGYETVHDNLYKRYKEES
jgi:integrase